MRTVSDPQQCVQADKNFEKCNLQLTKALINGIMGKCDRKNLQSLELAASFDIESTKVLIKDKRDIKVARGSR